MHDTDALNAVRKYFPQAHSADSAAAPPAHSDAPQARRRAGRSGSRLDLWTHNRPTGPHLELNLSDCGAGHTETSVLIRDAKFAMKRRGKARKEEGEKRDRSDMSADDLVRSTRRAVKMVRQSAKVLGADRILTLTSRRYLTTPELFWRSFAEFSRLMKKRCPFWAYVAVPELHPKHKDHYHAHLAIRGHYDVNMVRLLWRHALRSTVEAARFDHSPGNIDISHRKSKNWHQVNGIAKYISKYLTKQMDTGLVHAKRYEKSRGLQPKKMQLFAPLGLTDLDIIRTVQELSGGTLSRNPRWDFFGGFDCLMIETEPSG